MPAAIDAVALCQALIRCPSVTPEEAGALGVLEAALKPLGFKCERLRFEAPGTEPVENLYARLGDAKPPTSATILSLVSFAIVIWGFIEMGVLRGTRGDNKYGPDPLTAKT